MKTERVDSAISNRTRVKDIKGNARGESRLFIWIYDAPQIEY